MDTFRRTDSSILKDNGEDVRVVQERLRHASTKVTLDVYTQALTPAKRLRDFGKTFDTATSRSESG